MKKTTLDKRFFESTRGRIVMLLRGAARTVDELAKELGLTDNAIRGHLLSLERDGLVRQAGLIKGFRKPHYTYSLTDEADLLFPKSYDSLFNQLLEVLKNRLSIQALREVLSETGRRAAGKLSSQTKAESGFNERLESAVETLAELGGAAELAEVDGKLLIKSNSCPLASAVVDHPEVCKLTESLIEEIVGVPVKESCNREKMPQCHFEIEKPDRFTGAIKL